MQVSCFVQGDVGLPGLTGFPGPPGRKVSICPFLVNEITIFNSKCPLVILPHCCFNVSITSNMPTPRKALTGLEHDIHPRIYVAAEHVHVFKCTNPHSSTQQSTR